MSFSVGMSGGVSGVFVCVSFVILSVLLLAPQKAAGQGETERVKWTAGEWDVEFDAAASRLTCEHKASGARVEGALAFTAEVKEQWQPWPIVMPRDSVKNRPAFLGEKGNVQGYLTVTGSGGVMRVHVVHRSAQNYQGRLTLKGEARLGEEAFACRTRQNTASRVVQLASGNADSALNDSLFCMQSDTVLRLGGERVAIRATEGGASGGPFSIEAAATPHVAADSALEFEVIGNYYRDRYVPYYRPINKERCPSPPTGWMSWNVYFDTAGEQENLAEARVAAEHLKPFGLEIWHIESWQDNSGELPVAKFHNLTLRPYAVQFPHGMKWLADEIRKLGFRPGIWTVPFGTGDKEYYEAHKEWFLHDADGKPMRNWCGYYVLDPSQEAVRRHMEETHRIMSQEWGYEYFKIDGMSGRHSSYCAHFYERDEVRAAFKEPCEDPFRLCVEALRRGMGPDRLWLACQGHYSGAEIGFADAGRIGADIVHAKHPPNWNNYSNQARTTLNQLFVNNIVWYGDPDTLLVGTANPDEVVRLATSVVGLSGQMMFAGDKLAELPPDRMRLLQQCLPVCDIQPRDLFPIFEMLPVWDLKIRRPFGQWDVVSLFNWSDSTIDIETAFAELGLEPDATHIVYDFWNQTCRGTHKGSFTTAVPPRGNVLLAVHSAADRPQFLSTDRHITQGGVSLESVAWNAENNVLKGRVALVGGHGSTLTFFVPQGYALVSATAENADAVDTKTNADGTLSMSLTKVDSGTTAFELTFRE